MKDVFEWKEPPKTYGHKQITSYTKMSRLLIMVCMCMYVCNLYNKIQYTKIKQFKKQISDKNLSIEKSLDHRWQG